MDKTVKQGTLLKTWLKNASEETKRRVLNWMYQKSTIKEIINFYSNSYCFKSGLRLHLIINKPRGQLFPLETKFHIGMFEVTKKQSFNFMILIRLFNRNFKRHRKTVAEESLTTEGTSLSLSIMHEWKPENSNFSVTSIEQITECRTRRDGVFDVGTYSKWSTTLSKIVNEINTSRTGHVSSPDIAVSIRNIFNGLENPLKDKQDNLLALRSRERATLEQHLVRFVYWVFATETMRFPANLLMIQMILDLPISEKIDFQNAFGGSFINAQIYPMAYEDVVKQCRGLLNLFNRYFSVK